MPSRKEEDEPKQQEVQILPQTSSEAELVFQPQFQNMTLEDSPRNEIHLSQSDWDDSTILQTVDLCTAGFIIRLPQGQPPERTIIRRHSDMVEIDTLDGRLIAMIPKSDMIFRFIGGDWFSNPWWNKWIQLLKTFGFANFTIPK